MAEIVKDAARRISTQLGGTGRISSASHPAVTAH
jgi:hypothetical protein